MTAEQLLPLFSKALAERISQARYEHYFAKSRLRWEEGELVVGVPNLFFLEWLSTRFQADLEEVLEEVLGKAAPVRFEIDPELFQAARSEQEAAGTEAAEPPAELPGLEIRVPPSPAGTPRRWHTLEDFVVGACNRVAFTASRNLIDRVVESPTLITLFGGPGVGKTHLLEGLYTELRRSVGDLAAICVSAEEFTNRFSAALALKATAPFRRQFREVQALFIDNIDFLAAKPVFQEEMLHTFEALARLGRPVVVTSQVHPRELKEFSPQLLDRLVSGGMYELEPPDHRTRLELLRARARKLKLQLPRDAEAFLADLLRGNVRELVGVVTTLWNYQQAQGKPLTLAQVREVAQGQVRRPPRIVTLADVEKALCQELNIDVKTLHAPTRARNVSHARMLAIYLARQFTKASSTELARHFGYKSHSMVMAAEKKVRKWLDEDAPLFAAVERSPVRELVERVERELNKG